MRQLILSLITAIAFASSALADGPAPSFVNAGGNPEGAKAVVLIQPDGTFYTAGGGGGSGGDASAANQVITNSKLDTLHSDIATTLVGFVDGLEGSVDGLELLISDSNTQLALIISDIDTTNTKLTTLHNDVDGLEGSVDGLEGLITSSNTKLDTIHGDFTGLALNASVDGIEGLLTTQAGYLDGLEALIGTTNTNTTGLALNTSVDGLEGFVDGLEGSVDGLEGQTGIVTETAPASDTASSGLNGRAQRIAQRITSLIALYPTSLGSKAAASSFAITQSTEDAALVASTNTKLDSVVTDLDNIDIHIGVKTETAPATDTASSGLNGREQRIAQNITTLTGKLPTALGAGGGLKIDGSGTSLPVSATLAAETTKVIGTINVAAAQSIAATQSGTWTVQPGNTANTTAWKVDGSAVTQPVSIASATGGDQSADGLATSLVGLNTRAFHYGYNGATWDRDFICKNTAVITVATGTTVQIVALAAAKTIYVCSFVISTTNTTSSLGNIFKTGTGTLCATGITSLTGALNLGPFGHEALSAPTGSMLVKSASASALCLTNASGGVDGFLTYAQF